LAIEKGVKEKFPNQYNIGNCGGIDDIKEK